MESGPFPIPLPFLLRLRALRLEGKRAQLELHCTICNLVPPTVDMHRVPCKAAWRLQPRKVLQRFLCILS